MWSPQHEMYHSTKRLINLVFLGTPIHMQNECVICCFGSSKLFSELFISEFTRSANIRFITFSSDLEISLKGLNLCLPKICRNMNVCMFYRLSWSANKTYRKPLLASYDSNSKKIQHPTIY